MPDFRHISFDSTPDKLANGRNADVVALQGLCRTAKRWGQPELRKTWRQS